MAMMRDVVVEGTGQEAALARIPGGRQDRNSGEARCERWLLEVGLRRVVRGRRSRDEPRIVVLVTIDEPRGAIWGGTVAAPAFADIARFAPSTSRFRPTRQRRSPLGQLTSLLGSPP